MNIQPLSPDSALSQDQSPRFASVVPRVLAGGIAAATILKLFGLALSSGRTPPALTWQGIAVAVVSGVLYVAVMLLWHFDCHTGDLFDPPRSLSRYM